MHINNNTIRLNNDCVEIKYGPAAGVKAWPGEHTQKLPWSGMKNWLK